VRWPLWIFVAVVLLPGLALARPKVAVAPLDGDDDGKLAVLVAQAAATHGKVTSTKLVTKALDDLSIASPDNSRAAKRLRARLAVDAVIYGKLEREGTKKKLTLSVYTRGKKPDKFTLEYKSSASKQFRKQLRDELADRLAPDEKGNDDDDDDDAAAKKAAAEKAAAERAAAEKAAAEKAAAEKAAADQAAADKAAARRKRKAFSNRDDSDDSDDAPKTRARSHADDSDDPPKKRSRSHGDDDAAPAETAAADDDTSETTSVRKRHRRKAAAEEEARNIVTQAAFFGDIGAAGLRRTLTYSATAGTNTPPAVGTFSFSGRLDAELYPGAFTSVHAGGAGFGVFGSVGDTVGLSIQVPTTTQSVPITQAQYVAGVRYRFVFGQSSLAVGAGYWSQVYTANRSGLTGNAMLNMPDVDYQAVAPGVLFRIGASPKVGIALQADVPLMLSSGPITAGSGTESFGAAAIVAFAVQGAVDVALAAHYGLHFAASFDQVQLSFKAPPLSSATDSTYGVTASFALLY
jgi:hypothetical protein